MRRVTIAVTVFALCTVGATSALVLSPTLRRLLGVEHAAVDYVVGQRVDLPLDSFPAEERNLLLFVRGTCSACQNAVPALKQFIVDVSGRSGVSVRMVTSQLYAEDAPTFALRIGLSATQIMSIDMASLRLQRIPTLLVVNRAGVITRVLGPAELPRGLAALADEITRTH